MGTQSTKGINNEEQNRKKTEYFYTTTRECIGGAGKIRTHTTYSQLLHFFFIYTYILQSWNVFFCCCCCFLLHLFWYNSSTNNAYVCVCVLMVFPTSRTSQFVHNKIASKWEYSNKLGQTACGVYKQIMLCTVFFVKLRYIVDAIFIYTRIDIKITVTDLGIPF